MIIKESTMNDHETISNLHLMWAKAVEEGREEDAAEILEYIKMVKEG